MVEFTANDFLLITELAKDDPVKWKRAQYGPNYVYTFFTKSTGTVKVVAEINSFEENVWFIEVTTKKDMKNTEDVVFSTLSRIIQNFLKEVNPNLATLSFVGKHNVTNAQVGLIKKKIATVGYIPQPNLVPGGLSIVIRKKG